MKRIYIASCIMCLIAFTQWIGCDSGTGGQEGSIQLPEDPGPLQDDCCGVYRTVDIEGVAPPGGAYYYPALVTRDSVCVIGGAVFVDGGPYSDVQLTYGGSYLDGLAEGEYEVKILSCDSVQHIGKDEKRTMAGEVGFLSVVSYTDSLQCDTCCTKQLPRYYSRVVKEVDSAIGCGANIIVRYGQLCGNEQYEAQMGAWVGMQDHLPPKTRTQWIQIGYVIKRWSNGIVDTAVYVEAGPVPGYPFLTLLDIPGHGKISPPEHSDLQYHCYVAQGTGGLSFWLGGTHLLTLNGGSAWVGKTLKYVSWGGEIDGRESDMPGTSQDPCCLSNCFYRLDDGYPDHTAKFGQSGDIRWVTRQSTGTPDEWDLSYIPLDDAVCIWDEYPL